MRSILECNDGDIVASDVINDNGVLIVVQNTEFNPYIKQKLMEHKIQFIHITEPYDVKDKKKYKNDFNLKLKQNIKTMKSVLSDLAMGNKLDIDKVNTIADFIYQNKSDAGNIAPYLKELQEVDEYTYAHCINTSFYAMLIGTWLHLTETEIYNVIQAGLLHDIGKVKIPDEILNKQGKLTNEEYEIMKQHTVLGYDMLRKLPDIHEEIKNAVLLHHERMDGSGYPLNATLSRIGLYAKIIAVADVFDAMTSDRVYKKHINPFEAFEMFKTVGLGKYDTGVIHRFVGNLSTLYVGMKVKLSNGNIGKIAYVPPHDVLNPIILIDNNYYDLMQLNSKIQDIVL